ncbi:hypothetical protein HID58_096200 [Brassica napus]|uniref:RING-CH-type domain-containing protein n=1 Tax=Brassica napus TaxID=3708 RepID=A0ABQ7X3D4_BRANA|nr:hypothetical protein HID58_096200 [Brassica napus]
MISTDDFRYRLINIIGAEFKYVRSSELCTDRLITAEKLESEKDSDSSGKTCRPQGTDLASSSEEYYAVEEEEPLLQSVECRICQEEDTIQNLEAPCACNGSLKYAHRNVGVMKGDITCEICHQAYQPGYTAPPPPPPDETIIHIGDNWENGVPLDLSDPRILAMAAAERHFLEADYDEYSESNSSGAAFCRSSALIVSFSHYLERESLISYILQLIYIILIMPATLRLLWQLMALLLLRDALNLTTNPDDEDDPTAFFSFSFFVLLVFSSHVYIMAWAIGILQRRRQRQFDEH